MISQGRQTVATHDVGEDEEIPDENNSGTNGIRGSSQFDRTWASGLLGVIQQQFDGVQQFSILKWLRELTRGSCGIGHTSLADHDARYMPQVRTILAVGPRQFVTVPHNDAGLQRGIRC